MKKLKYIICVAALGLTFTSCEDLDLEPKGIYGENVLLGSEDGIQTYLVRLYNNLPIEDFNYGINGDQKGYRNHDNNQWQACKSFSGAVCAETMGRNTGNGGNADYDYWPYGDIRQVNNFITQIKEKEGVFSEQRIAELEAEGRFLRAFYYFGLAKHYGGVPIVDEVLDPMGDKEDLKLPRATEYDTWKFIHDDLDFAMKNGAKNSGSLARANRYTAAALMTRAMLYAASVANYSGVVGTTGEAVKLGLQTMGPEHAEEFYRYVREAAEIVKEGGYTLHPAGTADKYTEIFIKENAEEDLLVKRFLGAELASIGDRPGQLQHWDAGVLPIGEGMSAFVGAAMQPVWDLMGMYEHPALVDENGKPIRFDNIVDFANSPELEPRCKANFWFPGMLDPVSGKVFDIQCGLYSSYPGTAADGCPIGDAENDYTRQYRFKAQNNETRIAGNDGRISWADKSMTVEPGTKIAGQYGELMGVGDEGYTYCGAFIRKYVDTNSPVSHRAQWGGTQSWKVFRYAEVLLNLAEADYELFLLTGDASLKQEAENVINQIRERAGCKNMFKMKDAPELVEDYGEIMEIDENLQYIRDERERELCLENMKYWDIRRWRVGHIIFSDAYRCTALKSYLVYDENKYIFLEEPQQHEGRTFSWSKGNYYRHIPGWEIDRVGRDILIDNN